MSERVTVKQQTLCWDCANATGNCSWSKFGSGKPIPGWKAEETQIKNAKGYYKSYIVYECPQFIRDAFENGTNRKVDKHV